MARSPEDGSTFMVDFLFHLSHGAERDAVKAVHRALRDAKRSKESMVLMAAAISRLLLGEAFAPEVIANAIADDNYPIHVRLLLATAARREKDPEWRKPLDQAWQGVQKATWPVRLKAMDPLAWAEILLGDFLGDPGAQELMRAVDDEAAFPSSPLAALATPLDDLRCELYFYRGIRSWAEGGAGGREGALTLFRRALATRKTSFFEHTMASYLAEKLPD
jgi:hypothetical protein